MANIEKVVGIDHEILSVSELQERYERAKEMCDKEAIKLLIHNALLGAMIDGKKVSRIGCETAQADAIARHELANSFIRESMVYSIQQS